MNKDTTKQAGVPELLAALLTLLAAHRVAFRQERPYRRAVALVFGELFAFARHTVTQTLLALGLSGTDWTAFYRLFSRPRFEEATLNACLFRETLVHSRPDEPYVTAIARVTLVVRTARNRRLRHLPPPAVGRGRRRRYGDRAPQPQSWLRQRQGFHQTKVVVRGRSIQLRYRVQGPYLREGVPERPLFLVVVGGATWRTGKRKPRRVQREPAFYLVNAVAEGADRKLPLPAPELLAWLWQRWELEVAHREMKAGFGVGQKQCWNRRSAVCNGACGSMQSWCWQAIAPGAG